MTKFLAWQAVVRLRNLLVDLTVPLWPIWFSGELSFPSGLIILPTWSASSSSIICQVRPSAIILFDQFSHNLPLPWTFPLSDFASTTLPPLSLATNSHLSFLNVEWSPVSLPTMRFHCSDPYTHCHGPPWINSTLPSPTGALNNFIFNIITLFFFTRLVSVHFAASMWSMICLSFIFVFKNQRM